MLLSVYSKQKIDIRSVW